MGSGGGRSVRAMRDFRLVWMLFVVGCGGGGAGQGSGDAIEDAAPGADATRDAPQMAADAAVDAGVDAAPPAMTFRYVIDRHRLPTTSQQAMFLALDIDGDGDPDNGLGRALVQLQQQGLTFQPQATAAIDRGAIISLIEVTAESLDTDPTVTFAQLVGTNPQPAPCSSPSDATCRKHLTGAATFSAEPTVLTPLAGAASGGDIAVGPGLLQLPTTFGTPMTLDLVGARVLLRMPSDTAIADSVIAGAISVGEIKSDLHPRLAVMINEQVAKDCKDFAADDCGCLPGTQGDTWVNMLHTVGKDCIASGPELQFNAFIQTLFAPDVTINGQQALSVGIGVTAVRATFAP